MFVVCGTQHWRAELPPDWCAQHSRGNVAIFHPKGVGALQISSFRNPKGNVAMTDLQAMAEGFPVDVHGFRPVQVGEFVGLRCESMDHKTSWVQWFVARGAIALHVTYNCIIAEHGREHEVIERVVASLKCPLPQSQAEPEAVIKGYSGPGSS